MGEAHRALAVAGAVAVGQDAGFGVVTTEKRADLIHQFTG
jgi:hypothetical protein